MPLIRYIQKITRDPNFLVWRDAVYVDVDGRPQYLSLKLISDIDALLQGKISEYVFQSEFKEVKFSCDKICVLGRNLVAEYLFYESNGNVLHDSSGNKYNGTIYGCTWKQTINGKRYLYFPGTVDNYVYVPYKLPISNAVSVETIVYFIDHHIEPEFIYPHSFVVEHGAYSQVQGFCLWKDDNSWLFQISNGAIRTVSYTIGDKDKWVHLIGNYNGNEQTLYYNGVKVASQEVGQLNITPHVNRLYIGRMEYLYREWWGYIALVRIWNRGLTDNEINILYKLAKIMVPELGQ